LLVGIARIYRVERSTDQVFSHS